MQHYNCDLKTHSLILSKYNRENYAMGQPMNMLVLFQSVLLTFMVPCSIIQFLYNDQQGATV